uniref:Uncharacterized protein n=1 Tax=Chromera velia CCMP2878 TaxID=1169474 RepID=A0A0G4GNA0_9ALVE|eukprot:Cvel_22646.t1-p1 / transcript=Cvel_22646.t1 / gene=Cvel_22646 / organism=Chromera_velia_CCMP2878 / gene_product=Uncharacterized protein L662, putative / transcript_product=Uncharacterized protein L662, putative / location=Cvel_scaffold2248:331-1536(+) / protein_length=402 / sequence_SO=supercontig / SO=protein_coding / is_pseudo=false
MHKFVDLQLPKSKKSPGFFCPQKHVEAPWHAQLERVVDTTLANPSSRNQYTIDELMKGATQPPSTQRRTFAVGTTEQVFCGGNTGLFGTVYHAWANHWNLRTSPDDWWLAIETAVAKAVDEHAEHEKVRELFVQGKKEKTEIRVDCDSFSIYDTDYTYLFNGFQKGLRQNIAVPEYADAMSADFSTTTPTQRIGSQIALMKSVQKYFDYTMGICGCGVKGIEMLGSEADWIRLGQKLAQLRKLLAPLEPVLRLESRFDFAEYVFMGLLNTYRQEPAAAEWWSQVLYDDKEVEYGPSGMSMGHVEAYNGWLVRFTTGREKVKASKLAAGEYDKSLSCVSSVPMKIVDEVYKRQDNATMVGGMLGFTVTKSEANGVATLQPSHGWSMLLLTADSCLRKPPATGA